MAKETRLANQSRPQICIRAHGTSLCIAITCQAASLQSRNVAVSDFDFRLRAQWESATLLGMESPTHRKPQPGWTGTRALRIVQATPRTFLSVDPIGRRSAVATLRSAIDPSWRSRLRLLPPVSVTLRDIETGGANLAQSQNLRALQRSSIDAKVSKPAFSAAVSTLMPRPRLIRGRCNIDRPEASGRAREDLLDPSVLLLEINSRVVERKQPGAAGASSGCKT